MTPFSVCCWSNTLIPTQQHISTFESSLKTTGDYIPFVFFSSSLFLFQLFFSFLSGDFVLMTVAWRRVWRRFLDRSAIPRRRIGQRGCRCHRMEQRISPQRQRKQKNRQEREREEHEETRRFRWKGDRAHLFGSTLLVPAVSDDDIGALASEPGNDPFETAFFAL